MNWDRVGTMKKIDDAGESLMKKVRNQREAGKGVGVQERWKMAQGKDERWEQSKKQKDQDESEPSSVASSSHTRVPPTRPPSLRPSVASRNSINSAPPPPPPARSNSSISTNSSKKDYIEFSKFTEQDKLAFFQVLDRFFNDKLSTSTSQDLPPIYSPPDPSSGPKPPSRTSTNPIPQSRGPAPTITPRAPPTSTSASTSSTFPLLTASSSSIDDPCSALSTATFFVYPESFPEWTQDQWYTSTTDRQPPNLKNRKDILWKCSTSYMGSSHKMIGSVFFQDLSMLIYQISWDSNRSSDYQVQVEYKDIPQTLDNESLKEASEIYGESIARFAEMSEIGGRPIGDGECWTLAKEAIDNVNKELESKGRSDLKALSTIGRTHGHLIFAGQGARNKEDQKGRWRGGDRKREEWGGVRRGDIVEWYRSTCSEVGARKGSWVSSIQSQG